MESSLKIGLLVTESATSSYQDLMDQIRYADEVGFDSIWLRERHFHADDYFFSSPFIAASYIAAKTKQVRIGIGARLLLDHPIHLAERGATVDVISNGRMDFGIEGVRENEFYQNAFGIVADGTQDRFEQSFEIIVKAWTEEQFSYEGLYNIPEVSVLPKPFQKPHPPIYLVESGSETLKFGAKLGLPIQLGASQTIPLVKKTQEDYYQLLQQAGYQREDVILPVNRFIYVAETEKRAIEETRETLLSYDLPNKEVYIFGDPDECLRQIEAMKDTLDLRNLILTFNYCTIDHKKSLQSMERFVKYVLPHLNRSDL